MPEVLPATPEGLFAAGRFGSTVALNLLRSLSLQPLAVALPLLEGAFAHALLKAGLRLGMDTIASEKFQPWLSAEDPEAALRYLLLVHRCVERLAARG